MPAYWDSYYVREEDGTSHLLLEDGSGALLLDSALYIDPESQLTPISACDTLSLTANVCDSLSLGSPTDDALALTTA